VGVSLMGFAIGSMRRVAGRVFVMCDEKPHPTKGRLDGAPDPNPLILNDQF